MHNNYYKLACKKYLHKLQCKEENDVRFIEEKEDKENDKRYHC